MIKENFKKAPRLNLANTADQISDRIKQLEEFKDMKLNDLTKTSYSPKDIAGNIESFIGSIEVPVGVAGPIKMKQIDGTVEDIFAPLATNEGALIASITRGAYAINLSGGFDSRVIRQRMSRCPMFSFENMNAADNFKNWITKEFQNIKKQTKKYSNYADLVELDPQLFGRNIHLKFDYETADASGQNMTTTCTWNACLWIESEYNKSADEQFKIKNFVIEANGSSDKKVSAKSRIATRGIRVVAECFLNESVIKRVLKSTSQDILDLYIKANAMAVNDGMVGYNVNVANAVAAFFASTGQDLASIHESAVGILQMEKTEKGLYVALTLPSLVIGTIGGGTGLKGAKESLSLMDCFGEGKVNRFASIICGFAMGLELSTMAAITSGQFASSHERLGRNRPIDWLKSNELDIDFFKNHLNEKELESVSSLTEVNINNGIVSDVTARVSKKLIGFFPFKFEYTDQNERDVLLKLKALDTEVLMGFELIANLVSPELKNEYLLWRDNNCFINSHVNESVMYTELSKSFSQYIPKFYGNIQDSTREVYGFCIDFLNPKDLTHFNSENDPNLWKLEDQRKIITAIGEIHGNYIDTPFKTSNQLLPLGDKQKLKRFYMQICHEGLSSLSWFNEDDFSFMENIIHSVDEWYRDYLKLPKTLAHNDFSPRNICFKNQVPCFYDWELSQNAPAQRDLIEFLAFTCSEDITYKQIEDYCLMHLSAMKNVSDKSYDLDSWINGLKLAAYDFMMDRLSFYMIGNIINQFNFLERVFRVTSEIIDRIEQHNE